MNSIPSKIQQILVDWFNRKGFSCDYTVYCSGAGFGVREIGIFFLPPFGAKKKTLNNCKLLKSDARFLRAVVKILLKNNDLNLNGWETGECIQNHK